MDEDDQVRTLRERELEVLRAARYWFDGTGTSTIARAERDLVEAIAVYSKHPLAEKSVRVPATVRVPRRKHGG